MKASDTACTDDGNACTDDVCNGTSTACQHPNNSASCDDGTFCNGTDTCSGGICTHDGDPCPGPDGDGDCSETCDEDADECSANDTDGSSCDDGDLCSETDECSAGLCAGSLKDCDYLNDDCNIGVCDPQDGECIAEPVQDYTPCEDDIFCNGVDTCQGGTCAHAGDPCESGPECLDACNEGAENCKALADTACGSSEENTCNHADTCDGDGNCLDNFEPTTTECRAVDGVCDAAEFCDGAGNCPTDAVAAAGVYCVPEVDDEILCTDSRCDGAGTSADHCLTNPQDALCEDGNTCTADTCDPERPDESPTRLPRDTWRVELLGLPRLVRRDLVGGLRRRGLRR